MTLRIALVDDNPLDRDLAGEAFEDTCPACTVEMFSSGQAALRHLRAAPRLPDVMLLDLNMPGLNGFEVLTAIKTDPRLNQIPVVMLTTSKDPGDVTRAYTLHASSYLVKAPSFPEFVKQIEAFVGYWTMNRAPAP
jgi:CheY-like chemotaxis protein